MPRNFLEDFFWTEDTQVAKEVHQRRPVGPTRHQGALEGPGAPWWVVEPMGSFSTDLHLYKYSKIPKTLGESTKHFSSCGKFQNHEIQSRAISGALPEGATITEGYFIILAAPLMMRE